MVGKMSIVFRILDGILLTGVYLLQNVTLNLFLIRNWEGSILPYFWFLSDFIILTNFYLTLYLVGCHHHREKKANRRELVVLHHVRRPNNSTGGETSSSVDGSSVISAVRQESPSRTSNNRSQRISEYNFTAGIPWFHTLTKNFPMAYVSWLLYSATLITKIVILFKGNVPQNLRHDEFLGPQMFKFSIGLSAIVFSLIVAAHKNARADPLRNNYLNNLCYRMALEILDSASFLTLLIPSESHILSTYNFENEILILASINLFLPSMTLYKLCATDFGRQVAYPIETWYKFIHLVVVDGAFMGVRIYLWSMFQTDSALFLIKNIYAVVNFGRELPSEFKDLKTYCCTRKAEDEVELGGRGLHGDGGDDEDDDSIGEMRMQSLNKEPLGIGVNLNDGTGYNWRRGDGSISTRGVHGSAQSSLVQVYAINSEATNGHVPTSSQGGGGGGGGVDDSNSQLDDEDTTNLVEEEEEEVSESQSGRDVDSLDPTVTQSESSSVPAEWDKNKELRATQSHP